MDLGYQFVTMVVLLAVVASVQMSNAAICTDSGTNSDTEVSTEYVRVRYGHYTELRCCQHYIDHVTITWFRYSNESGAWHTLSRLNPHLLFLEEGQTLAITSAELSDTGLFKCVAGPRSDVMVMSTSDVIGTPNERHEKKLYVTVETCDPLARGPYPIAPIPCAETPTTLGSTLMLPCTGYFGCDNGNDMRSVGWLVGLPDDADDNPTSVTWHELSEIDDVRYKVEEFKMENGAVLGANLTIQKIRPVDYKRRFMCVLYSSQYIHGQTNLETTLVRASGAGDTKTRFFLETASLSMQLTLLAILVVFVFVIATSAVCLYRKSRSLSRLKTSRRHLSSGHVNEKSSSFIRVNWTPVKTDHDVV